MCPRPIFGVGDCLTERFQRTTRKLSALLLSGDTSVLCVAGSFFRDLRARVRQSCHSDSTSNSVMVRHPACFTSASGSFSSSKWRAGRNGPIWADWTSGCAANHCNLLVQGIKVIVWLKQEVSDGSYSLGAPRWAKTRGSVLDRDGHRDHPGRVRAFNPLPAAVKPPPRG